MSAQTPGEPRKDVAATVQAMADNARAKSRAKQRDELAARHAAGQLALWGLLVFSAISDGTQS